MHVIIPAAGLGARFQDGGYKPPKPLIDIDGRPMIYHAIKSFGIPAKYKIVAQKSHRISDYLFDFIGTGFDIDVIEIDHHTSGPVSTCLLAQEAVDLEDELIIMNCDQIMFWDPRFFLHSVRYPNLDGAVVTYFNDTEKNSYARVNNSGYVTEMAEKVVISNISLNGIHYWRKGQYFFDSAKSMIHKNLRAPNGEFYVSLTYNELIKQGKNIGIFHIPNSFHNAVGVPEDLISFLNKNAGGVGYETL
ncbi:NTP transferase domain-containing protein [Polynucleobacter paneuropaeus]|nr:NTP transferase domain-containing protein [Polynucleobacter paneuropaeus]